MPLPLGSYTSKGLAGFQENSNTPAQTIKKSVGYVASGTDSNQILSISGTDSASAAKSPIPSAVEV